ncbi:MAG TPA: ATP synthase F1 subunit delta [Holophaga sp.]|nr:ATP synthase F1 subunit delta [Holophaga sp.]
MSNRLIAHRYAKALADLAVKDGNLVKYGEELAEISALVRQSPDLERLCFYPLLAPSQKAAAFGAVLEQGKVSPVLRTFFKVVAQAARLSLVHEIAACYAELVDRHTGVVEARVLSAQPLSPDQTSALSASLAKRTGKIVRLRWQPDPAILGGVKVQVGSTVFDASLQGQLRLLKAKLLTA